MALLPLLVPTTKHNLHHVQTPSIRSLTTSITMPTPTHGHLDLSQDRAHPPKFHTKIPPLHLFKAPTTTQNRQLHQMVMIFTPPLRPTCMMPSRTHDPLQLSQFARRHHPPAPSSTILTSALAIKLLSFLMSAPSSFIVQMLRRLRIPSFSLSLPSS